VTKQFRTFKHISLKGCKGNNIFSYISINILKEKHSISFENLLNDLYGSWYRNSKVITYALNGLAKWTLSKE